jgi:ABC-type molybdate transport system permease subunit
MGVKLISDAAFAGKLTLDECRKFHAFSLLSVLTAASTLAALPLAYGEVRAAIQQVKGD